MNKLPCSRLVVNVTAAAGIAAMLAAMLLIDHSMRYPGILTLLPCIGATAAIWAGERANDSAAVRMLSLPPLIFIGKLSYSLYLVHWPIVAFANLFGAEINNPKFLAAAMIGSIALAWLIYEFVEKPTRAVSSVFGLKSLLGFATVLTIGFVSSAAFVINASGFSKRLDAATAQVLSYLKYDYGPDFREGTCFLRPEQRFDDLDAHQCTPTTGTDVLLWGSSLLAHFNSGIARPLHDRGIEFAQMTASGCAAVLGVDNPQRPNCRSFNDAAFRLLMSVKPKVLVLEAQLANPKFDRMLRQISETGTRVIVLGPGPVYRQAIPVILARRMTAVPFSEWSDSWILPSEVFDLDRKLASHFSDMPGVRYVSY